MKFSKRFIKRSNEMCDFDNHIPAPYFRKKFTLDFKPNNAEITICGLGFYELYINGKNITKGPLAPYISNTDDICYYDNYDISDLLKKGDNVVGIILGNGFRNPFGGFIWDFEKAAHRGTPTVALCIEASDKDNNFELEADESFKTHGSPILFDDLRMGLQYDANLEIPDWNSIGFDDSTWDNAIKEKTPRGTVKLCTAEPIVITKELTPVEITHHNYLPFAYKSNNTESEPYEFAIGKNVYLYDFGVNTAGVTRLKIKNAKKGQKITVRHGEYFKDGIFAINTVMFNRPYVPNCVERYIEYGQTDIYICNGRDEEFVPIFKYDGLRYAYVEGFSEEQATEDAVTLLVMNSDLKERASFECSDSDINKLQKFTRRSDLANFYYFPTDCPHREKNGWTGDASMSAEHMLLNLTAENSLKEWLANIRAAQRENGMLPGVVPTSVFGYEWGNGPVYDSVCVNLPYYIYKYTGDKSAIEDNISLIMRYLCYIWGQRDEKGLVRIGLGDWIDPFHPIEQYASPVELTGSLMVCDMAKKASFLFSEIGRKNEAQYAKAIADDMRDTVRSKLIDFDTMTAAGDCQTSQALSIAVGIFDKDEMKTASDRLISIIHRDGDINTCGMLGLRYIYHVLSDIGESELAYKIIKSKSRSCYGYWLENGATTLWESFFDVSNKFGDSKNHHFLGDISSWFIQELAGLKPNPTAKNCDEIEISPHFINELDFAKAEYNTKKGKVKTEWHRNGKNIELTVYIPNGIHGKAVACDGYEFDNGTTERTILPNAENVFNCKMKGE